MMVQTVSKAPGVSLNLEDNDFAIFKNLGHSSVGQCHTLSEVCPLMFCSGIRLTV